MSCVRADERVKPETSCDSSKSANCHCLKFGNNNYLLFVQLAGPRVCAKDNCRNCLLLCLDGDYQYRLVLGLLALLPPGLRTAFLHTRTASLHILHTPFLNTHFRVYVSQ